jgi:hypothetical protein
VSSSVRETTEANTTHPDDDEVIPELVLLDQPRPLTLLERALVDFLLEPPYGDDQLRAQARTANVMECAAAAAPLCFSASICLRR